jgi:DNA recombination protein RmuC
MSPVIYAILAILAVGIIVLVVMLLGLRKRLESPKDSESIKVMADWMREIKRDTETSRQAMDKNIAETNKQINERLDNAAKVIGDLRQKLGTVDQIGPDIRRLAETLASPKLRGNFGEEMLERMLEQILPLSSFQIQYKFKNGETVDAIVRFGDNILPIDSKFSMENFRLHKEAQDEKLSGDYKKLFYKDVKKRIDEIHKKYVLPQEGTFDFALMYVPSAGVYQEIIIDSDIIEYARGKAVIPVGPNDLFIYLRNIVVSLRGQQVNEVAKEILAMITGIRQESDKFGKNLDVLATHVKNVGNTMGVVSNDFAKLKTSISNAASLELTTASEPAKLLE